MLDVRDKVVYQIYPRSFMDSDGDGLGDLNGITMKLDYLADLGVDYLWITPFFISPQNDNGYDVADYRNIDPRFGTMEDLERLIKEADKRNIKLMYDMVFNHTSTKHEWFQKALSGDPEYMDYYIFKDGEPDEPPTNWESKFGGNAWEYVPHLKKWYLHLFDVTQADLNWENPKVRSELTDVLRFWKEKGVAGFRFDVVNLISKADFENDYDGDGRSHYTDGPRVHEYIKELVREAGIEDMITVGEMSSTSIDNCVKYSGKNEAELSMVFHFQHLKVDYRDGEKWSLMTPDYGMLKQLFETWQISMQEHDAWDALFWDNHDQPRAVSRFGSEGKYWKESAKMLAGLIHLMRGTPYIYQGDELGMTNTHFHDIVRYRDVESINHYRILKERGLDEEEVLDIIDSKSRDNGRTPMQWSVEKNAGFSEGTPWIDVVDNYLDINAETQVDDPDSIFSFYRKLISIRKGNEVVSRGTIEFVPEMPDEVMVYKRVYDNESILVCANMSDREQTISIDANNRDCLISNYDVVPTLEGDKILLRPFEFAALQ